MQLKYNTRFKCLQCLSMSLLCGASLSTLYLTWHYSMFKSQIENLVRTSYCYGRFCINHRIIPNLMRELLIGSQMFKNISDIRLWYPKMIMKLFMEKVLNQYKKLEFEREIQTNSSHLICLDSKISSLILLLT